MESKVDRQTEGKMETDRQVNKQTERWIDNLRGKQADRYIFLYNIFDYLSIHVALYVCDHVSIVYLFTCYSRYNNNIEVSTNTRQ